MVPEIKKSRYVPNSMMTIAIQRDTSKYKAQVWVLFLSIDLFKAKLRVTFWTVLVTIPKPMIMLTNPSKNSTHSKTNAVLIFMLINFDF